MIHGHNQSSDDLGQVGFYLSSHDLSDPCPRKCSVVREIKGLRAGSRYLLVKVDPSLKASFWDGPDMDYDQIILALVGQRTLRDIWTGVVSADIVICPTYSGGALDERVCSRIGVGGLHATYAEALKHSPIEGE